MSFFEFELNEWHSNIFSVYFWRRLKIIIYDGDSSIKMVLYNKKHKIAIGVSTNTVLKKMSNQYLKLNV